MTIPALASSYLIEWEYWVSRFSEHLHDTKRLSMHFKEDGGPEKGTSTRTYNHTWAEQQHEWKNRGALTSIDISISGTQRYNISASTPLLPLSLFSEYSSWNNYWDRYLQAMYVPDPWSLAGWNSNWLDCRTHHWAIYKCAEKESVL